MSDIRIYRKIAQNLLGKSLKPKLRRPKTQMKSAENIKRRKADTERKTIKRTIRFTPLEYAKIEQNLKKENLTFSEFARASVLNQKIKKTPKAKKELLFEINKIGTNLNQITRLVNEKKAIDLQTLKAIFEIKEQLGKLS